MDDDCTSSVHSTPAAFPRKAGWKTRLETRQEFWELYAQDEEWGILTHDGVRIAHDGGVNGVGKLLYGLQYFYAMVMVGFAICNVYTISKADIQSLLADMDPGSKSSKFLLSTSLLNYCTAWVGQSQTTLPFRDEGHIIVVGELSCLVLLILRMLFYTCVAVAAPRIFKYHGDMMRWCYTAHILWSHFPQIASFSAMRLLYYVTPSVVGTEAYMVFFMMGQKMREATTLGQFLDDLLPIVNYVATRIAALIIGFDAFLVKLRLVAAHVDGQSLKYDGLLAIAVFLFQILNVVNLNWFVRERLFIFIFGGQGGNLSNEEAARADVWNALIAKRIYVHFGFWRFLIVMLGFDDYDFQMLVLEIDEDASRRRKSEILKMPVPDILGKLECSIGESVVPDDKDK